MAGGPTVETSPIFVFRTTFYVHRGSGHVRMCPRRWLSLSSRAKAFTLKGSHRRFVGDSAFHTSLRGAPLLVGEQQKWYHQVLQKVQNLMPHDYIKSYTVFTVVQQYVLSRALSQDPDGKGRSNRSPPVWMQYVDPPPGTLRQTSYRTPPGLALHHRSAAQETRPPDNLVQPCP